MIPLRGAGGRSAARARWLSIVIAGSVALAACCITPSAAFADETIPVPCAGNPLTSGPQGLVNAVGSANTYGSGHPGQKTTISVDNNCAYDFSQPYGTGAPDGSPTGAARGHVHHCDPGSGWTR